MDDPPIWTPDTSAINRLATDPDSTALLARLRVGFHVRLTFTSISELMSIADGDKRQKLLDLCADLLRSGDCIDPHHEILKKMVAQFEAAESFDWGAVRVDFPEAQVVLARREPFTDEDARQEREQNEIFKAKFTRVYENARQRFDRLFAEGKSKVPKNLAELVTRLQVPGGAFWMMAGELYGRVGSNPPDEVLMRRFVAECYPFRALMISFCAAQYDLCLRPDRVGPSFKAGWNDTLMATCLPYCHQFVTNDKGQLACYREVAKVSGLEVSVASYDEFRSRLFE